ncbi:hypothetical protein M409DRAFT_38291 [Zasmidium cellare ATCC 36951]|uniref:Uncharacterized protein n=1 Tax=Zasmidium cellare ATCC 36951 TaxID=1080233 RepID=A0A6A6BUJ5_ZASCE|nr:uncharacterized protein M409DRAFT_38291 [Zasmidium cellare ATCC 36951]KAF2158365.1 hypothetical protein M409DRAFT_38291 [Zasmidium cellare ATCC 36951]
MIQDTTYNLELQLQRIDEQSAQSLTEDNVLDISAELKEERATIEQCIGICGWAASNFSTLSSLAPSFTTSCLSEEDEEERTNILSRLQKEEPSQPLRRFLETLKLGSPVWDISIFAEYLRKLAHICGPGREEYYENDLKGLHYPASFMELWNQTYARLPITASDDDFYFQWVCPPGWTPEIRQSCVVYSYHGEAPLSEGLYDVLAGPATLDCGMRTQLFFWVTTIGVFGDKLFHEKFRFAKGQFVLTQGLYVRYDGIDGNPLLPYFDPTLGPEVESKPEKPQIRIQIKAMFNTSTYILKHPGGTARLQNVIQINEQYIIHEQPSTKNSLSATELDEKLRQAYNTPRTNADERELWRWGHSSAHIVHAQLHPKSFGDLFKEAEKYAHHMLSVLEWNQTRDERKMQSNKYRLEFNFERLKHHMKQTMLMTGKGLA